MSSTNRSKAREEHVADYYVTPINKIIEFLNEFLKYEPDAFNGLVLDPCAGGDKNHLMSYPEALKQKGITNIYTIDIREDSLAQIKQDYLLKKYDFKPKTIITNPPFIIAQNIIEKSLNEIDDNGFVIMLLRLNYFGGNLRKEFWNKQLPKYSFVYNRRLSFTDDKKTDSIEYMHCVWQKNYYPEFVNLKII